MPGPQTPMPVLGLVAITACNHTAATWHVLRLWPCYCHARQPWRIVKKWRDSLACEWGYKTLATFLSQAICDLAWIWLHTYSTVLYRSLTIHYLNSNWEVKWRIQSVCQRGKHFLKNLPELHPIFSTVYQMCDKQNLAAEKNISKSYICINKDDCVTLWHVTHLVEVSQSCPNSQHHPTSIQQSAAESMRSVWLVDICRWWTSRGLTQPHTAVLQQIAEVIKHGFLVLSTDAAEVAKKATAVGHHLRKSNFLDRNNTYKNNYRGCS